MCIENIKTKKGFFDFEFFNSVDNSELRYKDSIVSDRLLLKIREIVPPAEEFYKLPIKKQREINTRFQEIFGVEKLFKTLVSLEHRSEYLGISLQKGEYDLFEEEFKVLMFSEVDNRPRKKEALVYHFTEAVRMIKEQLKSFDKSLDFTGDDTLIARSINPKSIFTCFLARVMGKAYKIFTGIKNKGSRIHERGLSLKKMDVLFEIQYELCCHVLCAVLRHANTTQAGEKLTEEKLNKIFQLQFKKHPEVVPYAEYSIAIITELLFDALEKNNFLSDNHIIYESSSKKKVKVYNLNPSLDPIVSLTAQVPDLVKPLKITEKDLLVKDIFCGASEFKPSKKLLKAVDIANKTPYIVDTEALKLFKEQRGLTYPKSYKLPFPTFYEERKAQEEVTRRESAVSTSKKRLELYHLITGVETYHLKKEKSGYQKEALKAQGNWRKDRKAADILSMTPVTNIDIAHALYCFKAMRAYQVNRQKLLAFNTMVTLAECLEGYILYYLKFFDYRGRQLPQAWFAANTLGDLRYFVKIKDHYTINEIGLKEVFKAIYSNTKHKEEAANYLCEVSNTYTSKNFLYQMLLQFVFEYPLSHDCLKKNFIYKTLLVSKFKSLKETKFKTWIYVERDQKASSSVFMSILLKNKELASKSNLTGLSDDIIKFLQSRFREYFSSIIVNEEAILSLFEKDRNLLKKGFMFLSYGQKSIGRTNDFKDYLTKEYGLDMNKTNFQAVSKISRGFEGFVNVNLEHFCSQLAKLDKVFAFLIKASNKYSTVTLDGALLSWVAYGKPSSKVATYYNPYNGLRKSFRLYTLKSIEKVNLRRNLRGCKANLIHSFDGAIIREFSRRFKEKGYNILTIHDCVQYNPNAAELFKQIVEDIYVNNDITGQFFYSAFTHPRKDLQGDFLGDYDNLVAELFVDSKLISISKDLNYEDLYELE